MHDELTEFAKLYWEWRESADAFAMQAFGSCPSRGRPSARGSCLPHCRPSIKPANDWSRLIPRPKRCPSGSRIRGSNLSERRRRKRFLTPSSF